MNRSDVFAPESRPSKVTLPTRAMLVALMAGASLAFSMAFACATPFAALAAVSVLRIRPRDAFATVTLAWAINQADGFLFMHYPLSWDCVGWGAAIWFSAMAATLAASIPGRLAARPALVSECGALATAFIAYEATLLAATIFLASSPLAFAPMTVARLLAVDALAFALLLGLIGGLRALANIIQPNARLKSGGLERVVRAQEAT